MSAELWCGFDLTMSFERHDDKRQRFGVPQLMEMLLAL